MKRFLICLFASLTAFLTLSAALGAQSFPVIHEDPMVIRILDGEAAQPMAHIHILLVAGYDHKDLQRQFFHEEALTNGRGEVWLPRGFLNLPWLQVWVSGAGLCQAKFRSEDFSVERIRTEGYSAPNRCGTIIGENEPGKLTVYAEAKGQKHGKNKAKPNSYIAEARGNW